MQRSVTPNLERFRSGSSGAFRITAFQIGDRGAKNWHSDGLATSMLVICQEKTRALQARTGGRALRIDQDHWLRNSASRLMVPAYLTEPDIHLQSETPKSPHRRLSLGFLPVPKQFGVSLGSELPCPVADMRDLAVCASMNPDVFVFSFIRKGFYAAAVDLNSSAGTKFCFLRSTASM